MKRVVIAIAVAVTIVFAAGLYHFYRGAKIKSAQPCWGHLVNIASAKQQWALESGATSGAPVTVEDILPYLGGSMPTCNVAGGKYIIGKVGEEPRCTVHGTVSDFKPGHY